jgi:DnaJ-class molecular chaperone
MKQHHPDHNGNPKTFEKIKKAYDVLSNPSKRTQYDNGDFDESQSNDINHQAKIVLTNLFIQFVEHDSSNILIDIHSFLSDALQQQSDKEKSLKKKLDFFLKKQHNIIKTNDSENLYDSVLNTIITNLKILQTQNNYNIQLFEIVLEDLKTYKYKNKKRKK